jgi:hypothetical protein
MPIKSPRVLPSDNRKVKSNLFADVEPVCQAMGQSRFNNFALSGLDIILYAPKFDASG